MALHAYLETHTLDDLTKEFFIKVKRHPELWPGPFAQQAPSGAWVSAKDRVRSIASSTSKRIQKILVFSWSDGLTLPSRRSTTGVGTLRISRSLRCASTRTIVPTDLSYSSYIACQTHLKMISQTSSGCRASTGLLSTWFQTNDKNVYFDQNVVASFCAWRCMW